ncbi:poly(A)-specific ribonuclease PARN-like isoform X2 [Penaeus chinensis]|uniref:poly(A)-specific ribonuclease PARN-like isoform X2 n=1 Tax=Penaeus chinensis TaxID=139456 RepID=UPI001FB7B2FC|nr:poly(A)-specific ribonuclease PARN-like isoform X2 [Penaeus chinensis]
MEVTQKNFQNVLPDVEKAIERADFLSIDAEFTGLRRDASFAYSELDTAEERYSHATFCFYILGRTGEIYVYDNSSLRFLANNGFDFAKLYKEGLQYMTVKEENEKRSELRSQSLDPPIPSPVKIAEESAKKFLTETEEKMIDFMADETRDVLVIPGSTLTGFFRKILYNNIASKYQNILIRNVTTEGERNVEIRKFETQQNRRNFLQKEREKLLNDQVGFTHVVRKIIESGKVLVGHNLVLDLLHLINKTVHPLPEHLENFKTLVKTNIPTVYDTKLIAKDPPFCVDIPFTALGSLYKDLREKYEPPTFAPEEGYASHSGEEEGKAHNAGYDAFMTGVCFVTMVKKLDGMNWASKSVVKSKHLALYANRLNNMNSYDIPYLNIVGPDVHPNRGHIFSVECPSSWTPMHVHGLFHMLKSLKIIWMNSTHLYVIPMEEIDSTMCRRLLKTVRASCPPLVRVRMYDDRPTPKRKSESDDTSFTAIGSSNHPKEFKRLKSVGSSDQLSQMSLESPVEEDPPAAICDQEAKKQSKRGPAEGVFAVPEEW